MERIRYGVILLLLLWISIDSNGQEAVFEKKLSLELKGIALTQALDEISDLTEVSFSYSARNIPVNQPITIKVTDQALKDVLDQLFDGLQVDYLWIENKIVLRKARRNGVSKNKESTISGYVRDGKDGETLIGATILVENLGIGTITNPYGFYSITLPSGVYNLKYSYVGYEDSYQDVNLDDNVKFDITLESSTSILEEVIIIPNDSVQVVDNAHSNATQMSSITIMQRPSLMGEPDVIKSLIVVPGIQLFNDGSTFFNVRGGDRDQNQILVDEAPIYNPAHMLGLFSSFIPEAIKDIKIYKGNASADFGGRVSSVMDIHTKDGNFKQLNVSGRIGLLTTRLSLDGPLKRDHSSFFLSGRKSHVKAYLSNEDFDEFLFSDLTGKVNIKINNNNRLFLSFFSSNDEYLKNEGLAWKNIAGTIRWNHVFNDRLFSNTTLYSSKYEYKMISSPEVIWLNHIANASLKTDFTLYRNPTSTLKFGFRISGHNFNPGNLKGAPENGSPFVPKRNATELSLYYSNEKLLSARWLLTYGFRLSTWTNYGRTIEYTIDENHQVTDTTTYNNRKKYNEYSNLEPRIKLTRILNKHSFINFNYSRSAQYINLISNSISPFNNLEVWLPASVNIKPQLADLISLGWTHTKDRWQLNIEGYYKVLQNQLDYANQAQLLLNPQFEAELRSGKGTAYGFETILTRKLGKWTGDITYVFSRSKRQIDGINNDNTYAALSDRPHQFSINTIWKKSSRTNISGTLLISSGSPITTPTSFYKYSGRTVPVYSEKNNDRLSTYHRLDLGWSHRLNKVERRFNHFLSISIFNFYGRKNPVLRSFNKIEVENGDFIVPTTINNTGALTATQTFVYQIVPSLSYSFSL